MARDRLRRRRPDTGQAAPDALPGSSRRAGSCPAETNRVRGFPNGVRAKAAGLFCVAVPNAVTRGADGLEAADLLVASLANLSPEELLAAVRAQATRTSERT